MPVIVCLRISVLLFSFWNIFSWWCTPIILAFQGLWWEDHCNSRSLCTTEWDHISRKKGKEKYISLLFKSKLMLCNYILVFSIYVNLFENFLFFFFLLYWSAHLLLSQHPPVLLNWIWSVLIQVDCVKT